MIESDEIVIGPATIPAGYIAVPTEFYEQLIDLYHEWSAESPTEYAVGKLLEMFPSEGEVLK